MADQPLSKTAPAAPESREITASPTPSSAASATAAKPAKSPPAARKKAAAKPRPQSTASRSKAPAKRRSTSGARPLKPAAAAATPPTATGLGVRVADLVESNARPYASAQEQIASATRGTWIAPVAKLNARVITQVAAAQADLARRLLP